MITKHAAALELAQLGYPVFPCKVGEKKPACKNGLLDATTDESQIDAWWLENPNYNIGLATEGLLVVDIDGADNPLLSDTEKMLDLAAAPIAQTPRGGRHYFFKQPEGEFKNTQSALAEKVDTRARGGYVVAAPSTNGDGNYSWRGEPLSDFPDSLPLPPQWVVDGLSKKSAKPESQNGEIPKGQRNGRLTSLAGSMRRAGSDEATILAALLGVNATECSPPLPEDEVRKIAASVSRYEPKENGFRKSRKPLEHYKPFPVHVLPGPVGKYVSAAATAIGCDASFIALPLLACLARAIGNKRVIRLKRSWSEPAIIWAAIVGKSGTHKTPALQSAMQFLDRRQAASIAAHVEALASHELEQAQYDRDLATWKKGKSQEQPPWKPDEPACIRFTTSDCTIEALASLLSVQFDGLLVSRDELAGWIDGIAQYKGGQGSDLGHWLACWSGEPMTVDRKTGAVKMIHVPCASVSLVGGIQPGVLRTAIGREHMQDGLCARLLLAMPNPKPVVWTDDTVDVRTEQAMDEVLDRLLSLEPAASENDEPEPFPLDLTPEAKAVWIDYYNRHRAELADLDDDLAAAWSKLEAYAARFALIFQLCTWAAGDASAGNAIDENSMQAAIELSDWFGGEAKRVYGLFVEDEADREQRELVELIRRKGGVATARDLMRSCTQYRGSAGDAEAALNSLAKAGLGVWELQPPSSKGGRPTRLFKLFSPSDSDATG